MEINQIYNLIERINNFIRVEARQKGIKHGMQPIQLEALHYLSLCNKYSDTPMAVTEYLGQTKGSVSQTLKVLEKKEYLFKEHDKNDKRITHLKVTDLGTEILGKLIPTPNFIRACKDLPEEIQTDVASGLNHLLRSFLKSNKMKTFGVCHSCHYHRRNANNERHCELVDEPLSIDDSQLICREHQDKESLQLG